MKFRIKKLWCQPHWFDSIPFYPGVNLILGERAEDGEQKDKLNSVGKSLSIEFLHFALLRDFKSTRLAKIPEEIIPEDLVVIMDLQINQDDLQIRRSIESPTTPKFIVNGEEETFSTLADAQSRLDQMMFSDHIDYGGVSGRSILSLLMRDEASGFQDAAKPHSATQNIPPDIRPHLFLMGILTDSVNHLRETIKSKKEAEKRRTACGKLLKSMGHEKVTDIPMHLNQAEETTQNIEKAIEELRAEPAFEEVESELVRIEQELRALRGQRKVISTKIHQIESIPLPEQISVDDLKLVYDRIQQGLGELVERSFDQAQAFKTKIEQFQRGLQRDELTRLEAERKNLTQRLDDLSQEHAALVKSIDNQEALGELEVGLTVAQQRADDYYRLKSNYEAYKNAESDVDKAKDDRSRDLIEVKQTIREAQDIVDALEQQILEINKLIMLNAKA